MRKRKEYDDDDGKVIANMNVDGMPWYISKLHEGREEQANVEPAQLNWKERLTFLWGALSGAFLVTAVFGAVFAAVILLLIFYWK